MTKAAIIIGAVAAGGAALLASSWWLRDPPPPPPAMTMEGRSTSLPMPQAPAPAEPPPGALQARPTAVSLSAVIGDSARMTVVVANTGGKPVRITAVKVAGDGSVTAQGDACLRDVAGGQDCSIILTFAPTGAGSRTAELLVLGDGSPPLTVPVSLGATERPVPPVDPVAELLALLRQERAAASPGAKGGGGGPGLEVTDLELLRGEPASLGGARPSQSDYGDGVGRVDASLPVPLDRVLPGGSYISSTLETAIDTQRCPAPVVLKVDRHVLAGHGNRILLPAHSAILGQCVKMEKGTSRAGITLERVRRPDGSSAMIREVAADQMGRSGLVGELDDRAWERTAQVVLTSLAAGVMAGAAASVGSGAEIATTGSAVTITSDPLSAGATAAASAVTEQLTGTIDRIVTDSLDVVPRVTVAKGTLVTIVVTTDIWFPAGPEVTAPPRIAAPVIGEPVSAAQAPRRTDVLGQDRSRR